MKGKRIRINERALSCAQRRQLPLSFGEPREATLRQINSDGNSALVLPDNGRLMNIPIEAIEIMPTRISSGYRDLAEGDF